MGNLNSRFYCRYKEFVLGKFDNKECCQQLEIGKVRWLDRSHSKLACRNRTLGSM